MKSKLVAFALFGLTAGVVGLYPVIKQGNAIPVTHTTGPGAGPINQLSIEVPKAQKIELVFALDTTGSMSGLIAAAKEKIWSIASNMAQAQSNPEIKIGLVAYRDRGDAYVTKVINLSSDLDTVYGQLMDLEANGGGDTPESVNQALQDAVHKINWSQDEHTYRVIFLVGDAPPHMDYQDDVKFPASIRAAQAKGILVNTIQCGTDALTTNHWQTIASLGQGDYFQVAQGGSAVAVTTPFDEQLATLSRELDATRLYYGSKQELAEKQSKVAATEKLHAEASVASRARRAMFNSSESGKKNLLGNGDLVEDVASGKVELETLAPEKLPESIRALPVTEQEAVIEETQRRRAEIKKKIKTLSEQRSQFIKEDIARRDNVDDSLDNKLIGTLRKQAADKGLVYEESAISY